MAKEVRWGILATGRIARTFARGLRQSQTGRLVAVGSRQKQTAEVFGAEFDLPAEQCHGSYESLLEDATVDAVYIANPHPGHAEWAMRCAEAGKHILCEKPLAMNAAEAEQMIAAARRHDVFLMEAFMYRCHPQTERLVELVRTGAIGAVRAIQATFSFRVAFDPRSRLFDPALGGGGILDVGCYPASLCRLIAGAAAGQPFAEPTNFCAVGERTETGVDVNASAVARFNNGGIVAQLACGVSLEQENVVRVYGEEGWIFVPQPWHPGKDRRPGRLVVHRLGESAMEVVVPSPETPEGIYTLEADHAAAHLAQRQSPAMTWADSLGNMRLLDRWRDAIG